MARILIVEDDLFFADVLACTLGLDGHEVAVTNSASEGVRCGLATPPDIVVAAWWLKGDMHGGEVCRRIHAAWPSVKAIAITGHPECAFEAGQYCECVESVIMKPFHKSEILDAVRRVLVSEMDFASAHSPVPGPQDKAVHAVH